MHTKLKIDSLQKIAATPWRLVDETQQSGQLTICFATIQDANGVNVARFSAHSEQRMIAGRIVDAVNACAGMPDDFLAGEIPLLHVLKVAHDVNSGQEKQIIQLEKQGSEQLEALRKYGDHDVDCEGEDYDGCDCGFLQASKQSDADKARLDGSPGGKNQ